MKFFIKLLFWGAIAFAFSSCGKNYIYENEFSIEQEGWNHADTLNFDFQIIDTTKVYNLFLEVDHSTEYRFQNLYVQISTKFPKGKRESQTLSLELASQMGEWKGDCNSTNCTTLIPIQEQIYFQETGDYQITLEQFMRENPIKGLERFALKIEETELKKE